MPEEPLHESPPGSFAQTNGPSRPIRVIELARGELLLLCLIAGVIGVLIGLVLNVAQWSDVQDEPWQALDALGSLAAATATFAGLGAVIIAIRTLRTTSEQHRLTNLPYLRVYAGFGCDLRSSSFRPPEDEDALVVVTPKDCMSDEDIGALSKLGAAAAEHLHTLSLWVENTQSAPLGIAYRVGLDVVLKWNHRGGIGQPAGTRAMRCEFEYVIHDQPIRLDLLAVGPTVEHLEVAAASIVYRDVIGTARTGATGPASFVYSSPTEGEEVVTNGAVVLGRA